MVMLSLRTSVLLFLLASSFLPVQVESQGREAPVCLESDKEDSNGDTDSSTTNNSANNSDPSSESSLASPSESETECGLWLAVSSLEKNTLSLYAGTARARNERVAAPDLVIPLTDVNKNEWSPVHDFLQSSHYIQGLALESQFLGNVVMPGVGAPLVHCCADDFVNIEPEYQALQDSDHHDSALAGAFTYHYNFAYAATRDLMQGEELCLSCSGQAANTDNNKEEAPGGSTTIQNRVGQPIEWLHANGICLDTLSVAPSTLAGVGRGAFSKRSVPKGQVIATTPVVPLDRSELEMVQQSKEPDDTIPLQRSHGIKYTDTLIGKQQLLLNYCYSHPDSNFLLLPYAPAVSAINHSRGNNNNNNNNKQASASANAIIQWSPLSIGLDNMLRTSPIQVLGFPTKHNILLDYVALRDIRAGEEIFIDYGDEWVQAWDQHVREWNSTTIDNRQEDDDNDDDTSASYVSAAEFQRSHHDQVIRTQDEQVTNPYPANLRTACFFRAMENVGASTVVEWSLENLDCLRPCDVTERVSVGTGDSETYYSYTAVVFPTGIATEPAHCAAHHIPNEGLQVTRIPMNAVGIIDKPYSTDVHSKSAFRHAIGVPAGLYPDMWMKADPKPRGDFMLTPLKTGEVEPVRWSDTGEVVAPNAYRLGLGSRFRTKLLEYCDKIGITDTFRKVTTAGNGLELETNTYMEMNTGDQWHLRRPGSDWSANMHWISPGDDNATQDWLEMLSEAGFDDILKGIAESLNLTSLVAFHGTFMGVSFATKSFMHYDLRNSSGKIFNLIIPLQLANETGPELDMQDSSRVNDAGHLMVGRYRYEYDVASMMGDDAWHATSPADYRAARQFRMAATIFVGEITDENVDSVMHEYTLDYPRADREQLLSWAGTHWKKDDPSVSLPKPNRNHILLRDKSTDEAAAL